MLFVRLTKKLVQILNEHTEDGYVFRTDLRLRPDPGATNIAISTEAALQYYESLGQNWERAALIKARPIAGDIAAGEAFLARTDALHLAEVSRLRRDQPTSTRSSARSTTIAATTRSPSPATTSSSAAAASARSSSSSRPSS